MGSINLNYVVSGVGADINVNLAKTGGRVQVVDEAITIANDVLVNWTCDINRVFLVFIMTDCVCTIETNDNAAPQESFTMAANTPVIFAANGAGAADPGFTCPFAGDVTKLYVSSAATGNLYIRSVEDATP